MKKDIPKEKYTIGQLSKLLHIPIETLRYYEKSGITPRIQRNMNGYRSYSEDDKKWLGFVNCLKSTGMPLEKIKQYLKYMDDCDNTIIERRALVIEHKKNIENEMASLKLSLDRITHKVEFYDELIQSHGLEDLNI